MEEQLFKQKKKDQRLPSVLVAVCSNESAYYQWDITQYALV